MWVDHLKRIRRFLRDPGGNIWTDSLLLQIWNEAQREINRKTGCLEKAEAIQIPPDYDVAYFYDWEWAFLPAGHGYCHQALHYYQQAEMVICSPWEAQTIAGADGSSSDLGPHFTYPWEGFATPCADPIPLRFPRGFSEAVLVSWDRWPMEYLDKKELQSVDPSWNTQPGRPVRYWRDQVVDNVFYLYPRPSSVTWRDWDVSDGQDPQLGMITSIEGGTADSEVGTIVDIPGALFNQDLGAALEFIDLENNVFFIFKAEPEDLVNGADESDFPPFLRKYVEFAALERAFNADTDGKNDALRDFWAQRKEIGIEIIKRFIAKRRSDRDYRLVTPGAPGWRSRRQPKLPDTYPPV